MSKPKSISTATKQAILDAAWDLISESGRADVAMAEVAKRAGVSRQALFYAFGGRSGLLLAMVRHKDTLTDHVTRLRQVAATPDPDPEVLVRFAEIWLDYLPVIYPVGILLDAASASDPEAAAAWDDRMKGALLGSFTRLAIAVHARHPLPGEPARIAEAIWAQVHPTMFRRLVSDCGWKDRAFREHQIKVVRTLVGLDR
ncbi:TetR/AcrR family transcriptional regulator [Frigidibacter sp. RF13]|uniref:TetR/AcrR family transcriptional regulator n=1 Tax=Frigidibacter sp. RF13 TaxID=2997340 RepID=UPI00226EB8A4|nr:TetR/AcrR family transcriptional regulator [Frigidibacter sp. RF13]MCY1127668.1 TetR/AcrR family transcriptional regulator [Frigidibacter sp. RF13]